MAKSIMEVPFLGTQRTPVEGTTYYKLFYGDEPDCVTDNGLSIISMAIDETQGERVFKLGASFDPMEIVRITFEVQRGGQNKGKNVAIDIESIKKTTSVSPQSPQAK